MASVHLADEPSESISYSPSHMEQPCPGSSEVGQTSHHKRTSTTERSAEALAAAAAASNLARKVRDKSTEQAIDKPTQEFDRKRSNSGTLAVQEKGMAASQEPTDGSEDLRPSTMNPRLLPSQMSQNAATASAVPKLPFVLPESGRFFEIARPICEYLNVANVKISQKAFRLFEWCDLTWTPDIIRYVTLRTLYASGPYIDFRH